MGNYDQCVGIEVKKDEEIEFRGQQCSATFQIRRLPGEDNYADLDMKDMFIALLKASDSEDWGSSDSAPYTWALCVPSSCTAADVQTYFQQVLDPLNVKNRVQVLISVLPENCLVADETKIRFTASEIAIIVMIGIFAAVLIGSTSYDVIVKRDSQNKDKSTKHAILMSFSVYTNGKNLLNTNLGAETMACLHGLRFLSILWILFGHTYYMKSISPNINHIAVKYYDQEVTKMAVMNATMTTDTFFVLSGVLLCYNFMREWEKTKSFNILTFYIHRYLRLTPPYAFVIFFYATLLYHLGSGPLWNSQMGLNRDYCIENWWTNLLYINNYINIDRMCMNQTWYLAVDMQLFWLSPLLLYPLARWPKIGKLIIGITMIASVIIPLAITIAQNLTAIMLYNKDLEMVGEVYTYIYSRTYTRAGPYIIGITLGYLLHVLKGKTVTIPKICVALGWVVSIVSLAAIMFSGAVFYRGDHEYNAGEAGIYAGVHRPAWALCISWIAFACIKGYGGPVDAFLSWTLFIPLSRLTYCAYLCHYIFLQYNVASRRTPGYLSDYHIVHEFSGNFVLSFVLAAMISLAFEIPSMNLDKILLRRKKPEISPQPVVDENTRIKSSYDNEGYKEDSSPDDPRGRSVQVISKNYSTISLDFQQHENSKQ
ncbi:hypothetical protein L9F63_000862 [Diploptera punctata]|uniref:Nose resistant to fluoxetine protein 6 n=1 Tax=Diploptera punctata TaxID=6984 RepID=A0AAD8AL12_DIPPU|nr:hypothetical protein L9F63_000862 [Diploptera punctata]